jgi:hypothetical protein
MTENGKYVYFDGGCVFYVVSVTNSELVLSYVRRGNELKYTKVK